MTTSFTHQEVEDLTTLAAIFLYASEKWPHDPPKEGDVCQSEDYWHIWIGKGDIVMLSIPKGKRNAYL